MFTFMEREHGLRHNPATKIAKLDEGDGYGTMDNKHLAMMRAHFGFGTRARLAIELPCQPRRAGLRCDPAGVGNDQGDRMVWTEKKGRDSKAKLKRSKKKDRTMGIPKMLRAAIDAMPDAVKYADRFLQRDTGGGYDATPNGKGGEGNYLRRWHKW